MNAVSVILGENRASQFEDTLELMRQLHKLMYTRHERTEHKTRRLLSEIVDSYYDRFV